jgi:hypothetical protein
MKRVRLITTDKHNGKEAISRTPLRNRYFFEGAWHEVELPVKTVKFALPKGDKKTEITVKPEILRDAQIIETTEAIYAELGEMFDIRVLTSHVVCEMADQNKYPREATIDRQLRCLREYGKLNYEVIDEQKGLYRKLPVISKTCVEQVKIEFQPDWKRRFVEFLKREKAYQLYTSNLRSFKNIHEVFEHVKKNNDLGGLVTYGFDWGKTPEGDYYWTKLSIKWRAIYNGKN